MRGGLVGDDVELDSVGEESRDDLGRVADERDRGRALGIEMRGERLVVARDEVDPAVRQAPLGACGIDLDDERTASVQPDAEPLRAAHAAEPGGQHAPARERAAEVLRRDGAEGLVGEAEDALRADVEPAGGGHLAVHRQARVLEPAEGVLVGPLRDDHRGRDEDARRVLMGREHGHRLARLDDQRLVGAEALEGGDDPGQSFLGARRLAAASVDDERVGILGDGRVEVVEEAAERAFLLPAAAAQAAQAAMPGKSTRKEAPPPGLSSTQARPPCSAANCATSERPDPDSGRLDLASAREGLEDRLLLGVGHARAAVVHAQERTGPVWRDRHLDGRARGGVALGVGDEVLHDALELGRVDACVDALGLHVDLPAVGPAGDDAADELGEVGVLELDTQSSVPEPVHVEEVVEQPLEPRRLARDEADHLLPPLVGQGGPALAQGDGEAEDGGERRAQLVGDRGEDVLPDLLDALALGDVLRRPDHAHRVAGAVEDHAAAALHDPLASVPEDGTVRHLEGAPVLERHRDGRAHAVAVAGMDPGEVGLVVQLAALGLEVVDPVELVRPRDAVAGDVPLPAADVGEGLRLGEPHRGLAERLGGGVALRDRGAEREQADGRDGEEALEDLHRDGLVAAAERDVRPRSPRPRRTRRP